MPGVIVCRECGSRNAADAGFCVDCGTFLEWDGEVLDPVPQVVGSEGAPPAERAPAERVAGISSPDEVGPASVATAPEQAAPSASTTAAPPSAVAPSASSRRPVRRFEGTTEPVLGAGEKACPSCGSGNAADRRFCRRCGHRLARPEAESTVGPATGLGRASGRRPDRAARARFRRSIAGRHRLFRFVVGAFVVALIAVGLGAGGADPAGWGTSVWNGVRPDRFVAVEEVSARTAPPLPEAEDTAADAVDGTEKPWRTAWTGTAPVPAAVEECGGELAGTSALEIVLPVPTDVTQVGIDAALEAPDDLLSPAIVQVSAGERCHRLALREAPGVQRFPVDLPGAKVVRLAVVAAHGADEPAAAERLVAIYEVRLWTHH
jgi:ribosomal protein L40E